MSEKMVVKRKAGGRGNNGALKQENGELELLSVCENLSCPQQSLCLSQGLSVFHIMGNGCTRHCNFCGIGERHILPLNPEEPLNVARAVKRMNSKHVVLTSFTRDDLPDGGASHLAEAVKALHALNPDTSVEVILHSCPSSNSALETILESSPEVVTHNVNTVPRLSPRLFDNADYTLSVNFLEKVKKLNSDVVTKSGLMVGLGENNYEVISVISDLHDAGCNCITFNQYLPFSKQQYQLDRYVAPWEFFEYHCLAIQMGYFSVRANPFGCNSFDALAMYREIAE